MNTMQVKIQWRWLGGLKDATSVTITGVPSNYTLDDIEADLLANRADEACALALEAIHDGMVPTVERA